MVRTIVQIHSDGTTQHALLSYPLGDFDDDDIETPLSVDIEATKSIPPPETSVLRVGTALADDLSTNNAIRQAIQAAMAHPPHVVCFDARSSAARDFPWEALRYGQQFLALHKDFTVARLARPTNNWHDRLFVAPLKMLVVLAAAGPVLPGVATNCTREWLELSRALAKSKRPLKVTVLVAEPALKQQIEAWPKPAHLELTVDLLSSREHLRDALGEGPNILHIFCHGTANRPQLQLATPADMAAGLGKGSIVLEANQLSQIQGLIDSAWLVTLNCCESALSSREVHSLADALASAGFPAVIGMRELIAPSDAQVFSGALYEIALQLCETSIPPPGGVVEIEWGMALFLARQEVCNNRANGLTTSEAAEGVWEWTFPVLYVQPEPFRLRTPGVALSPAERQTLLAQLRSTVALRQSLVGREDTPPELLALLDQTIHDLEMQLT